MCIIFYVWSLLDLFRSTDENLISSCVVHLIVVNENQAVFECYGLFVYNTLLYSIFGFIILSKLQFEVNLNLL